MIEMPLAILYRRQFFCKAQYHDGTILLASLIRIKPSQLWCIGLSEKNCLLGSM